MGRVAGDSPKQRQPTEVQRGPISRSRAVVSLLESKRHPRIQFVLNVSGKEIAPTANWSKSSRIPLHGFIKAIVKICGPSCVTALRVGIGVTLKWKAQLRKSSLSANVTLRRDCRDSIQ